MALTQSTLETGINNAFNAGMGGAMTPAVAALLTSAYTTYAAMALDPSGDPPSTVMTDDLKDELEGVQVPRVDEYDNPVLDEEGEQIIDIVGGLPNSTTSEAAASCWAKGITKFWTGALFAVIIPPTGAVTETLAIVTLPPVEATLKANIKSILDVKGNTQAQQAADLAEAIHTATTQVQVTCTGIGPPPAAAPVILVGAIS